MPLPATARLSLVDQAISGMRTLLDSGEWPVGSRIPAEPVLAAELGVSRNTVREAVRALAHAGVLEVRRGDGTYVRAASEVAAVLDRHLGAADVRHVLEVRHVIEAQASALAASRRSARHLAALEEALMRRERAVGAGDADGFVRADADFHTGIVEAAGNPLLRELYESFSARLQAVVHFPPAGVDELGRDHRDLLAAIRDRDPEAAARSTTGLLDRAADLG